MFQLLNENIILQYIKKMKLHIWNNVFVGFSLIMKHFYEFHLTQKTDKGDFYMLLSN